MKHEFYAAISQIAAERGIPKEAIIEVMEKALVTAYRRTLGNNPPPIEVSVKLDAQTGMARVFAEKQVVDEVFDDRFEIDYVDAKRIKAQALTELGERQTSANARNYYLSVAQYLLRDLPPR